MIYRSKIKDIVFEFTIPEKNFQGIIVLCPGLPSIPKEKELLNFLCNRGFLTIFPRYAGTWESTGEFLKHSPSQDILNIISFLKKGILTELYANKKFKIKKSPIYIIGPSFGGSVALSLINSRDINKIVALSPVINLATHNKNKDEQDLVHLGGFIKEAFGRAYNFSTKNWLKMTRGQIFNPPQNVELKLAQKILILYDKSDSVVNYKKIENYSLKNDITTMLIKNTGHLSFSSMKIDHWKKIINWLKQ